MPRFEVEWEASGTAVVDADDKDEAEQLVVEAVENFETVQMESFTVEMADAVQCRATDEDDDE